MPLTEAADLLTDMMADRLRLTAGVRVIDVGRGLGQPAMRTARRADAHVTGASVSRDRIARATKLAEVHGLSDRVEFQHADAMRLPFADDSFDAALAFESILHMPDREQVLRGIRRVPRPGGRLVLTDFLERAPIPAGKRTAVDRCLRDFIMTLADPVTARVAKEDVEIGGRTIRAGEGVFAPAPRPRAARTAPWDGG